MLLTRRALLGAGAAAVGAAVTLRTGANRELGLDLSPFEAHGPFSNVRGELERRGLIVGGKTTVGVNVERKPQEWLGEDHWLVTFDG